MSVAAGYSVIVATTAATGAAAGLNLMVIPTSKPPSRKLGYNLGSLMLNMKASMPVLNLSCYSTLLDL